MCFTIKAFEDFIHYFNLKSSEIININDPKKLAKISPKNLKNSPLDNSIQNPLSQIISQIKIDKFLMDGPNGIVSLTKRESECIKLLGTGKSVKEVASVLSISPRTVEFYVNQVKEKTGCYSKSKLLKIIQSSSLNP